MTSDDNERKTNTKSQKQKEQRWTEGLYIRGHLFFVSWRLDVCLQCGHVKKNILVKYGFSYSNTAT